MALSPEAYAAAVHQHHQALLRYFLATTRAPLEDAEELVHRTFETLWRRREAFAPAPSSSDGIPLDAEGALRAWLFGLALKERLLFLRAQSRRHTAFARLTTELLGDERDDNTPLNPERILALLPSGQLRLKHCLAQLRPLDRRILGLFFGVPLEDGSLEKCSPHELPLPLADRDIAQALQPLTGQDWKPARVKMARHRALSWLRRCLELNAPPPFLMEDAE